MSTTHARRWLPAPVSTTIVVAVLVAACGGSAATGPAGSSAPTASPAPTPAATATPSPSPTPAATPSPSSAVVPGTLPHEAPELEALMPASVAGRPLSIWSMRGTTMADVLDMNAEIRGQLEGELTAAGKTLDDIVQVVAGRSDVANDPPYFVYAFAIPEGYTGELAQLIALASMSFKDMPDQADFTERTIGGKKVLVGTIDMLGQSEHQRGVPYVYDQSDTVTYFVITEDPVWAEEALAALP